MAERQSGAVDPGAPEDQFVEGFQRMLDVRDGGTYLRPAPDGFGGEIYGSLDEQAIHLAAPPRR